MQIKGLLKSLTGLVTATSIALTCTPALAYKNSIPIDNQWMSAGGTHYGMGDPYVMKYNGVYYMYVTTVTGQYGLKVWSSQNLTDWKYEGSCVSPDDAESWDLTNGTYAPEVIYWNGTFYLYSSSDKQRHKTFTSKSPLGPFVYQGMTVPEGGDGIDGSIYIDDDPDATKYFLHSGSPAIEYAIMNDDMLTGSSKHQIPGASVTGKWTEGPTIFKRNGKYYMTYTGNHCRADSYMIEYAAADKLSKTAADFKEPTDNRILISTDDGITGLGHNSIVVGPDLDSRYIVYHNLLSTQITERNMNIDRIIFNNQKLEVQGSTWWEMPEPAMPDFYDRMQNTDSWEPVSGEANADGGFMRLSENATIVSEKASESDYTAEFNISLAQTDSAAGALVSYTDQNNCAYAYLSPAANTVNLKIIKDGKAVSEKSAGLPKEYIYDGTLKKLTVKKQGDHFEVYTDDRLLIEAGANGLGGGRIGLKTENCTAKYGYTAFSGTVNGNRDKDSVKPTGKPMDAALANAGSRNFETDTIVESGAGLKSNYLKNLSANDWLSYKISAQDTSYYSADFTAKSKSGAKIKIEADGKTVADSLAIPASENFEVTAHRNIKLDRNTKDVKFTVTEGDLDIYSVNLNKLDDVYDAVLTQDELDFEWIEGKWKETADTITANSGTCWSKAAYGTEYMGDCEISADLKLKSGGDAGFMLRLKYATTASDNANSIGDCKNPDYHQGYYVYMNAEGVHIGKQVFNWKRLTSYNTAISKNKVYNLKARADGANIKVWLDGEEIINIIDSDLPLMEGKVGMRAKDSTAEFTNLTVTHLNPATPINPKPQLSEGASPLTKTNVKMYSDVSGRGYRFSNGGIDFRDSGRSVKGYLPDEQLINGTVACDIDLPAYGCFGTGVLLRCKQTSFGDSTDAIDGIEAELSRGAGTSLKVTVHSWSNRSYKGSVASAVIENYFDEGEGKTAHLEAKADNNDLTVLVDGQQVLTADISKWGPAANRTSVGFRSHRTTKVSLTNFSFKADDIPLTDILIDKSTAEMTIGDTLQLSAALVPDYATDRELNWRADNANVTVDQNGLVTAKQAGTAIITAESKSGISDSIALTIVPKKEQPNPAPKPQPIKDATVTQNGKTYYYNPLGQLVKNSVYKTGGRLYAADKTGARITVSKNTVKKVGKQSYIIAKNGTVLTAKAKYRRVNLSKQSYIITRTGEILKSKKGLKVVKLTAKTSCAIGTNGKIVKAKSRFKLIKAGGKRYIINRIGVIQRKKTIKISGKRYKTNAKGVVKK